MEEPDWWSFGSIIIYSLLNYLILYAAALVADVASAFLQKRSRNEFVRIRFFSRWNYSHQDQSRSNAGERTSWQDNDQNGFYSVFRRAKTEPNFLVDLTCHGSLLSCPPRGKLMQESEKGSLLSEHPGLFKKVAVMF